VRFPEHHPFYACRAEGKGRSRTETAFSSRSLRLPRQTGALHLARASPSAIRTGKERTMIVCCNAEVRDERRSFPSWTTTTCSGSFPAGLGPSAGSGDAATTRARVKGQASSSRAKGRQPHGCQEFPAGFASIAVPRTCNRLVLAVKSSAGSGGGSHASSASFAHFASRASHQLGAGQATSLVLATPATAWCWQIAWPRC
jgi:hypothetical protein